MSSTISTTTIQLETHSEDFLVESSEAPSDAVDAIPDGGYGWVIVACCSYLMFWINGYTTTWGVFQVALLSSGLKTDVQTLSFVGSLYMACMVAFSPLAVRAIDRFGIRISAVVAVGLFGLGLVAISFTLDNVGGLFGAGVLLGLATCVLNTATNSLPIQWFSAHLGLGNGLVKMGGGIGATIVPITAQSLIDRCGLVWTFRVFGFLILATGIPCSLLLRGRALSTRLDWTLLKDITFLSLALAGSIMVFSLYVPPFFLPLLAQSIGLSVSTGAALVAGFGASTALGRFAGGWLCDKIGALNALALCSFVNSLSMLAIWPVSDTIGPLFVFALVNGWANGSFFSTLPTAAATLVPGSATAVSLVVMGWTPGYLVGAPIASLLIQNGPGISAYRAAIFYAAGTGVTATGFIVFSRLRMNRKFLKRL